MKTKGKDCGKTHTGPFSFGCMSGVIRCDHCGKRVTEADTTASFQAAVREEESAFGKRALDRSRLD